METLSFLTVLSWTGWIECEMCMLLQSISFYLRLFLCSFDEICFALYHLVMEVKWTSRCPLRPPWAQIAVGAPWTRSTGGAQASGGKNREGDEVGTLFKFLKSQGPLGNLKFSLFSGAQMKKFWTIKLHNFSRSTTFVLCKFSFEAHILNYFKFSNLH